MGWRGRMGRRGRRGRTVTKGSFTTTLLPFPPLPPDECAA
jgi:hypothetical protein